MLHIGFKGIFRQYVANFYNDNFKENDSKFFTRAVAVFEFGVLLEIKYKHMHQIKLFLCIMQELFKTVLYGEMWKLLQVV